MTALRVIVTRLTTRCNPARVIMGFSGQRNDELADVDAKIYTHDLFGGDSYIYKISGSFSIFILMKL